jgi:hypothetical protein
MKKTTGTRARRSKSGGTSLLGRILSRFRERKHDREMARLQAHLAWTPEQKAAVDGRRFRRG